MHFPNLRVDDSGKPTDRQQGLILAVDARAHAEVVIAPLLHHLQTKKSN